MKSPWKCLAAALSGMIAFGAAARAQVLVTDFNNFVSDELYASWNEPSAAIVSGEESYSITASGYGSNYKFINVIGSGSTHVELEVSLSGPPAADGQLGPIISFVDGDGSYYNYAWFGQTLGDHVLRAPLAAPSWISAPGSVPGLDLDYLPHMHMQLDPAQFGATGAYTVEWENLNLITAGPGDFDADSDVDGADFLLWQRNLSVGSLADWKANFGTAPPAGADHHGVPEPGAAVLLVAGVVGAAIRSMQNRNSLRRKKQRCFRAGH
jgi:hypothetical protein